MRYAESCQHGIQPKFRIFFVVVSKIKIEVGHEA